MMHAPQKTQTLNKEMNTRPNGHIRRLLRAITSRLNRLSGCLSGLFFCIQSLGRSGVVLIVEELNAALMTVRCHAVQPSPNLNAILFFEVLFAAAIIQSPTLFFVFIDAEPTVALFHAIHFVFIDRRPTVVQFHAMRLLPILEDAAVLFLNAFGFEFVFFEVTVPRPLLIAQTALDLCPIGRFVAIIHSLTHRFLPINFEPTITRLPTFRFKIIDRETAVAERFALRFVFVFFETTIAQFLTAWFVDVLCEAAVLQLFAEFFVGVFVEQTVFAVHTLRHVMTDARATVDGRRVETGQILIIRLTRIVPVLLLRGLRFWRVR